MERRHFFGTALAALVGWRVGRKRWGHMTVQRATQLGHLPARVTLDGVDVSNDALVCDDINGYVIVYDRKADGLHMDPVTKKLARKMLHGEVRYYPRDAA